MRVANQAAEASAVGAPPLAGVRVVALEQAVAGPLCTQHLRDLGADVIKIERPGVGDFARSYDGAVAGHSAWFYWLNRGKRSLALDLKRPEAVPILNRLLERADVLVQNLAPGSAERMGLGTEVLRSRFPTLIVCNISGYGSTGPYRHRKAYDTLLQGEVGAIAITGTAEAPARMGVSVADIATGMYSLASVLAALYARQNDGAGRSIEVTLFDALSQWLSPALYGYLATGRQPGRGGVRHSNIVPYGLFKTGDGTQINLAVQNEREWERFCAGVLQEPELAHDPRYDTNERRVKNRSDLERYIEQVIAGLTHAEIVRRLEAADVPWGDYRDIAGLAEHPQLLSRGRLLPAPAEGLPPVLAHPMNIEGVDQPAAPVPAVGADSDAVLVEIGFGPAEIEGLHRSGALG
jgi:itaconate CoA-transferase